MKSIVHQIRKELKENGHPLTKGVRGFNFL